MVETPNVVVCLVISDAAPLQRKRATRELTRRDNQFMCGAVKVGRPCAVSQTTAGIGIRVRRQPYRSGYLTLMRPKNSNRCDENMRYRTQASACADSSPNSMVNFIKKARRGAFCRCQERD